MQKSMAGFALGILLSLPAATTVFAAQSIDTAAFTITYREGLFSDIGDITLIGQEPGAYRFSLDTLNADVFQAEAQDSTGGGATASAGHASILRIEANAGYRVTGLFLDFNTVGELTPGQLLGFPPGIVTNGAGMFVSVWGQNGLYSFGNQYGDFQVQEAWQFGSSSLTLGSVTDIAFNAWLTAQAFGVEGGGEFAPSLAMAGIRDAVLRVEVSAIPEPATYAMLLAGAALLGVTARRAWK